MFTQALQTTLAVYNLSFAVRFHASQGFCILFSSFSMDEAQLQEIINRVKLQVKCRILKSNHTTAKQSICFRIERLMNKISRIYQFTQINILPSDAWEGLKWVWCLSYTFRFIALNTDNNCSEYLRSENESNRA